MLLSRQQTVRCRWPNDFGNQRSGPPPPRHLYCLPQVLLSRAAVLMRNDEVRHPSEEPIGTNAAVQHSEDARALAVRYRVEAFKDARDVTVVLLHHRMAVLLRVCLQQGKGGRTKK